MSIWHPRSSFQPETLMFLCENETVDRRSPARTDYTCSCQHMIPSDEWHLCEFHEGFDAAIAYARKHPRHPWAYRDGLTTDDHV